MYAIIYSMSLTLPMFDLENPSYQDFRDSLKKSSISIAHDEESLGFIGFFWNGLYSFFTREKSIIANLPLYFLELETDDLEDREIFDSKYDEFYQQISSDLNCNPFEEGRFTYPHRQSEEYYRYSIWALKNCRLALLQNEYDIQFGFDISLRYLYSNENTLELLYGDLSYS
jgi:hypothetical protein